MIKLARFSLLIVLLLAIISNPEGAQTADLAPISTAGVIREALFDAQFSLETEPTAARDKLRQAEGAYASEFWRAHSNSCT